MKRVVVAFLLFAAVAGAAYLVTEPTVNAEESVVVVELGGQATVELNIRNSGTVQASVVGANGNAPRVRLPRTNASSTATAVAPASGEVEPRLTVEASEDVEPGEYTVEITAWRLPGKRGERNVERVTVVVEDG